MDRVMDINALIDRALDPYRRQLSPDELAEIHAELVKVAERFLSRRRRSSIDLATVRDPKHVHTS